MGRKQETHKNQLVGSRSLCQHGAIRSHYYLCILKQITLPAVLLLSLYVQKKNTDCVLDLRIHFCQAIINVTLSEQWLKKGTRKVTDKVGDQELFLQLRGLIRIRQRHPEGNPRWIFPLLPSLPVALEVQISCRKQKMNDAIGCPLPHLTKTNPGFVLACFFVYVFVVVFCFWKANWECLMVA